MRVLALDFPPRRPEQMFGCVVRSRLFWFFRVNLVGRVAEVDEHWLVEGDVLRECGVFRSEVEVLAAELADASRFLGLLVGDGRVLPLIVLAEERFLADLPQIGFRSRRLRFCDAGGTGIQSAAGRSEIVLPQEQSMARLNRHR